MWTHVTNKSHPINSHFKNSFTMRNIGTHLIPTGKQFTWASLRAVLPTKHIFDGSVKTKGKIYTVKVTRENNFLRQNETNVSEAKRDH